MEPEDSSPYSQEPTTYPYPEPDRCRALVGKPEGRRPLGRPRRRWEDNIKMDLREAGWGRGMDRSGSGYEQVAGFCKCGNELSRYIKRGEFLEQLLRKDSAPWT
jgi:hypothetical protein